MPETKGRNGLDSATQTRKHTKLLVAESSAQLVAQETKLNHPETPCGNAPTQNPKLTYYYHYYYNYYLFTNIQPPPYNTKKKNNQATGHRVP